MSDSDLTQSNDTAVFPATADFNTNADPFLIPTDGKKITGSSNASNQAPVNRSIKRLHALIAGLRSALIGDFDGAANRKTVCSLETDGVGGFPSTVPTGNIEAFNKLIAQSDVQSSAGVVRAGTVAAGQRVEVGRPQVAFLTTGTGASDANPPLATSIKNQLRAKNTPKGWVFVHATAGVVDVTEGCGNWAVTTVDTGAGNRYRIRFTLNDPMDSARYAPIFMYANGGDARISIEPDTLSASTFDLTIWGGAGIVNVTTMSFQIVGIIAGQQTT